jgi:hypothetical protein
MRGAKIGFEWDEFRLVPCDIALSRRLCYALHLKAWLCVRAALLASSLMLACD